MGKPRCIYGSKQVGLKGSGADHIWQRVRVGPIFLGKRVKKVASLKTRGNIKFRKTVYAGNFLPLLVLQKLITP
jgi:hypothetical protein